MSLKSVTLLTFTDVIFGIDKRQLKIHLCSQAKHCSDILVNATLRKQSNEQAG